jgi:cullin-associated NEDD8-dissociated protein 1
MHLQAFQQLAHPEYGIMMVDFRPVDCESKRPIQFDPGFISDKIYEVSMHLAHMC